MTKVHPNLPAIDSPIPTISNAGDHRDPIVLTVWRKSLLFNCNGFTVFDCKGNLIFRVDSYMSENAAEVVLMDADGNAVLTLRRKKLSLAESWLVFEGEEAAKPRFSAKKHVNFLNSGTLAHVAASGGGGGYEVEGSYSQRRCVVYDERRRAVAEIQRKEAVGGVAFGADVFRLVVRPGIDAALAMAVVVLLERMYGSRGPMALIKC